MPNANREGLPRGAQGPAGGRRHPPFHFRRARAHVAPPNSQARGGAPAAGWVWIATSVAQMRPRAAKSSSFPTLQAGSDFTCRIRSNWAWNKKGICSHSKPRVRITFPEFGFGSVSALPGLDSDRFRQARFGFGPISPGQVRTGMS